MSLRGEIDMSNFGRLHNALRVRAAPDLPSRLVVDLSGLTFLSVAGAGTLLDAQQRWAAAGVALTLTRAVAAVRHCLHLTAVLTQLDDDDSA